jgi:hypothetical protein
MRRRWIWIAPAAIVGMAVFLALGSLVVKLLWNWLTPTLFGWQPITFWQAVGLLGLCRILFGGLGLGGAGGRARQRMSERMEFMTPEERERFRQRMRERWGLGPAGRGQPE